MLKLAGKRIEKGRFSTNIGDVLLHLNVSERNGAYAVSFQIEAISTSPAFVADIEIGEIDYNGILFVNNFQSSGPCKFLEPQEFLFHFKDIDFLKGSFVASVPGDVKKGVISDYFVATDKLFLGFISSKVSHPYFVWQDGLLRVRLYIGKKLFPSEVVTLDRLWIKEFGRLEDVLREYTMLVAAENSPRIGREVFGWCLRGCRSSDVLQKELFEELELLKKHDIQCELFQLCEGYERDIGDWLDTKGIESLATRIRKAGMIPGIWLAPFSVSASSNLFKEHPDWVVRENDDRPRLAYRYRDKDIYALDTSHPDVLDWLSSVFLTLKRYGYAFFGLGFLFSAMCSGNRYGNVTPVEAYRIGMSRIRMSVGDAHLLGCDAPLLPSIGYVDSVRVSKGLLLGRDAGDFAENLLTKNFMNRWWRNDSGCMAIRSVKAELSGNEMFLSTFLPFVLGANTLVCDRLSVLSQRDIYFLKASLGFRGKESLVSFVDTGRFVVVSRDTLNGDVVALINLSDRVWSVKEKTIEKYVDEKEKEFFVSYPDFTTVRNLIDVKPHSASVVLHRGKRTLKVEHERKSDGRMFHYYYGSDHS